MREIEQHVLLGLTLNSNDPYRTKNSIIKDDMVNECLMDMYFFMLSSELDEKIHNELWEIFLKSYHSLNRLQQEIVKQDYIDIINAQDKYEEENKGKIKKKGMINYE